MKLFLFAIFNLFASSQITYETCQVVIEDLIQHEKYKGRINLQHDNAFLLEVEKGSVTSSKKRKFNKIVNAFNLNLIQEREEYPDSFTIFGREFVKKETELHATTYETITQDFIHQEVKVLFSSTLRSELPRQFILSRVNERTGERNRIQIWHFYGFR